MTYKVESSDLETYFKANWSATEVQWPNVTLETKDLDEWAKFFVRNFPSEQITLGMAQNVYRHPGLVVVQIFVGLNTGAVRMAELVDTVCALFRSKTISGCVFSAPAVIDVGISSTGAWYQKNVQCNFYRDEAY